MSKSIIPKQRRWTTQAIECLNSGFDCKNCIMTKILSSPCIMRQSVFECYRALGRPKHYIEKTFI